MWWCPGSASPEDKPKGTPFTRAEVEQQVLPLSSIYIDLFTRARNRFQRRSTTVIQERRTPGDLQTLWREPGKKRGRVLLVSFLVGNSEEVRAIALKDNDLHPLGVQQFGYSWDTAEPEYRSELVLDQTDARGVLKIGVLAIADTRRDTLWYEWDGTGFVDRAAPYFVIAARTKTRGEGESFAARQQLPEYEIVPAGDYKLLAPTGPHGYVVVAARFRDRKQAEDFAEEWRKVGKKYVVQQAF